jgi:hypothetical protein|uniref:Uncharacterized protein n=1 Tax=Picea glauca TaxID=3330 RepID=A0A101M1Y2_PICGL|nr:hypothetical protein ABT39_MTgene2789 [Picea glauca]
MVPLDAEPHGLFTVFTYSPCQSQADTPGMSTRAYQRLQIGSYLLCSMSPDLHGVTLLFQLGVGLFTFRLLLSLLFPTAPKQQVSSVQFTK